MSQGTLNALCAADGLDKLAAGRAERGEIPLGRALRDALCRHLEVPTWWFTDERVELPERLPLSLEQRLEQIEAALTDGLGEQRQAIVDLMSRAAPEGPGTEGEQRTPPEEADPPSQAEGQGPPAR